MTPTEYAQKQTDYWRGKQDEREAMRRFDDGDEPAATFTPFQITPYTGPFIDDPYEKYYDKR